MTAVDAALFRQLLGRFATGVTVITTRNAAGEPEGMTASSVASVSLDPPLLLVSVDRQNVMHDALSRASHFVVNVLAADQEALSRRFAELEANRFDGVGFHISKLGLPLLDGVLAHIECTKDAVVPAGDHTVFLGLVTGGVVTDRRPLLYYRGGYANLSGG
jgi:flavin reductase (DIM6/NTAB) family NADH-FMN oxidoreductase RutF